MKFSRDRHKKELHQSSREYLRELAHNIYTDTGIIPDFDSISVIEKMKESYFRKQHYIYYHTSDEPQYIETFYQMCGAEAAEALRVTDRHGNFDKNLYKKNENHLDEINCGCKIYRECIADAVDTAKDINECTEENYEYEYYTDYIYYLAMYHSMSCHLEAGIPSFIKNEKKSKYLEYKDKRSKNHCYKEKNKIRVDYPAEVTRKPDDGYVYLIGSMDQMFFKVGISRNPQARLKSLQTSNPIPLEIIAASKCEDPKTHESNLHGIYKKYRQQGEWFKFPGDVLGSCINRIQKIGEVHHA